MFEGGICARYETRGRSQKDEEGEDAACRDSPSFVFPDNPRKTKNGANPQQRQKRSVSREFIFERLRIWKEEQPYICINNTGLRHEVRERTYLARYADTDGLFVLVSE